MTILIGILKSLIRISLLVILGVLLLSFYIQLETKKYIYEDINLVPRSAAALVPGTSVLKNGELSAVLMDRADSAALLYEKGVVGKILITGDNSTLLYNEVSPVKNYLLAKNVNEKDIFLDHAGFDTYSSMYRARDIFLVDSVIVVTQSFHLRRAIFIARHLGLEAVGFSADRGHYLLKNSLRELLANVKAVINLVTGREPKFLGEKIPLDGEQM